jgi:hypothetical protein
MTENSNTNRSADQHKDEANQQGESAPLQKSPDTPSRPPAEGSDDVPPPSKDSPSG